MKILLFHPTLLPPKDYGGVERVVLWLARGLVERGHEVWVAAFEGSRLPPGVRILPMRPERASAAELLTRLPSGVELVHFQAPADGGAWEGLACAKVLTVHGNGKEGEKFPRETVFLSADHARRHGAEAYVHNGIDPEELRFDPKAARERFLFLSKTSWRVKNVAAAIRYCAKARAGLVVAGGNRPWLSRARVALTPGMTWAGPVAGARKAGLLAEAKALVFPVIWPEPFGLVVAEALMSGAPVIGSRLGSVPELVGPEVGVVLDPSDEAAWVDWLSRPKLGFDSERCRQWALDRFHYRVMAAAYERVYERVIRGEVINPEQPVASGWRTVS